MVTGQGIIIKMINYTPLPCRPKKRNNNNNNNKYIPNF